MAANYEFPPQVFGLDQEYWNRLCELSKRTNAFTILNGDWDFDVVQSYEGPVIIRNCENYYTLNLQGFHEINRDFFNHVIRETFKKVA